MSTSELLLKRADIEAMDGVHKTHFLNPNAKRRNRSLGDAAGLQSLGVHLIEVLPGHESTEFHSHQYEEECVYVLSGTATAVIGDQRYQVGPGDFMGFPRNAHAHTMINDGDETLVCLVVGQRLAQDVSDYPNKSKRLYRNSGRWDLVDLDAIELIPR